MKKILLVKLSSMGDLIQMFPALTDASQALPGIQFDWLVEDSFKEIPVLHPGINKIITLPYRRWKKEGVSWQEIKKFLSQLRNQRYDMVIDAQSNLKSALLTLFAKGKKYGLDKKSVREYGAHLVYQKKATISRTQNHGDRMRQLMAAFLNYPMPQTIANYGIVKENLPALDFELPQRFIFINHLCSSKMRLWPEPYWAHVIDDLLKSGYEIVMPWWTDEEKERLYRLKKDHTKVHAMPPLNLPRKASVLARATAAIGLDTGLSHMAASLDTPNICLYGATSAEFTGTVGKNQIHLNAKGLSCIPCLRMSCHYQGESQYNLPCMETIKPEQVLQAFYKLMHNINSSEIA